MKTYGYQSLTRIRLINLIANPNPCSVGTCNEHELLMRDM